MYSYNFEQEKQGKSAQFRLCYSKKKILTCSCEVQCWVLNVSASVHLIFQLTVKLTLTR